MSEEKINPNPTKEEFLEMLKEAARNPIQQTVTREMTSDEERKRLGNKFEISMTYTLGRRKYSTTVQFPMVLLIDLKQVGEAVCAGVKAAIDDEMAKVSAFNAGFEAGQKKAAQEPAEGETGTATTSPSEQAEEPTGGVEAK